jgi:hypothetical protein
VSAGRRWTWIAAAVGVGAALAVPLLARLAAQTLGDSTTGTLDQPEPTLARLASTPGALLMSVEGDEVVGLTVFALDDSGTGGTVLVLPTGSSAVMDGFDRPNRLAAAYTSGGADEQVTAAEGLLGVTFSATDQLDEAGLRALLAPLAPISVDLPEPVVRTIDGTDQILLPKGPQDLTADQAAAVLFARRTGESESFRLPNEVAVWKGIMAAVGRAEQGDGDPEPAGSTASSPGTSGAAPAEVPAFLQAVGAGPSQVVTLPVTRAVDAVTNPDGIDLLQLDVIDLRMLMARILPSAVSPTGSGLRIRLVNHTGEPAALYDATARLQFVGANVVAIDDAASGPATGVTSISYDPALTQEQVDDLTIATGPAAANPASGRIDGIDVTIDLGQDFLTFLKTSGAAGDVSTTTTAG